MLISWRSLMIRSPGSRGRKCLIYAMINFSAPAIAWGDIRPRSSSFTLLHRRHYRLWPQLCVVQCLSVFSQDEYRGKFCCSMVIGCITAEAIALIIFKLHMVGLLYNPPPMVLIHCNGCSSLPIGAPLSGLLLRYFIQCIILASLSALFLYDGHWSILSSTSIRSPSISFQTVYLRPLSWLLNLNWLLCCLVAPQSSSSLLGLHRCPSISFCTPPSPSALPLPTLNSTSGTPPLLVAHRFLPQIQHISFQTPYPFTAS